MNNEKSGESLNLNDSFQKLTLSSDNIEESYADITQLLKDLSSKLEPKTIVKSPLFDLFQGTHALEINNAKLDTGLIENSEEELLFDTSKIPTGENELQIVTSILDKLFKLLVVWLDESQSLSSTILSCRYVETILIYYSKHLTILPSFNTGSENFDFILKSGVCGILYFVKFICFLTSQGVLLEEEDINTHSLDINIFQNMDSPDEIIHLLNISIEKLSITKNYELILLLKIILGLTKIEKIFFPSSPKAQTEGLVVLDSIEEDCRNIIRLNPHHEVPKGSFSNLIQKNLNNFATPRDVASTEGDCYQNIVRMVQDVKVILKLDTAKNSMEIERFAEYFNLLEQKHPLARAIFPLYLMRSDQSILGNKTFFEFLFEQMKEIIPIVHDEKIEQLLQDRHADCENLCCVLFEWYQNNSLNKCRIRQGFSKQMLLWDSAQANLQDLDASDNNADFYPNINSWIYLKKLKTMIDFQLKGFELELYKTWESFSIFWSCYCLLRHKEILLTSILDYISKETSHIKNINKKAKKLQGERREKMKKQYKLMVNTVMPELIKTGKNIQFELMNNNICKKLCLVELIQFGILKSYNKVDNKLSSSMAWNDPELLHNLRFKSFQSIGIPELPSFKEYNQALEELLIPESLLDVKLVQTVDFIDKELLEVKHGIEQILKSIGTSRKGKNSDDLFKTNLNLVLEESFVWYTSLLNSVSELKINAHGFIKNLSANSKKDKSECRVELVIPDKCNPMFPILKLYSGNNSNSMRVN
ncbi:Mak10p SCDLUD_003300 [Saccharomycodes ludwigii]|uniref:Mak10p n=1 Tax=Saccharomycodes ludwigii TaxID=36035 RepID=UPI001E836538|nr:hypothetical protein SCDLUD_003300 [Saccharomycodes ludwigii]KAH3900327.1 hypothetical protein SCDLUD_003300 [Saccharomycodes ludwigii]